MAERVLHYQYQPRDFGRLYRQLRPAANIITAVTAAHLLLAMLPSMLLLLWGGDLGIAALFLAAGLVGLTAGRWIGKRHMRRQFLAHCLPRQARIADEFFELEWELGWMRCSWSWLREVGGQQGWLLLRRGKRNRGLVAAIPPSAADEKDRALLLDELSRRVGSGPPPPPRDGEGATLQEVEFQLDRDEMAQVAERIFLPRRRSKIGGPLLALLVAALAALSLLWQDPQLGGLIRMMLAAAMILAALSLLAPWKRRALGALLGDESLLAPQAVAIRESGIEYRHRDMQSLARWPQIAGVIDARRFLAVVTSHGGLICVPRRALPDGRDDEFLRRAREQQRRHAESQLPPSQTQPADTGNPYQPPG